MAAAFFNLLADPALARAESAGTAPGAQVHPEVVTAMREAGLELSGAAPRRLTAALAGRADHLITMGCGDACPVVPGLVPEDWPFPDPRGRPLDEVRAIRDGIRARVVALLAERGWQRS